MGDDDVDFEMLKNYNGFRMENSSDLLMKNIKKSTKSVEELIKYIEDWDDFGVGDKNHGYIIQNK